MLSPYTYDGLLLWKVDGEAVKIYEHYVGEEKQAGVYLGGYNGTTTWGFKYYPAMQGSFGLDYFQMRLLPEGEALGMNETRGFVRIREA